MNPRLVIWAALVFSTIIYFGLAVYTSPARGDFEQSLRSRYVPVLYGLALLAFVFAWLVVPRVVRSHPQTRMVAAMAMFEASSVFGLVAAFLVQDWRLFVAPWVLTLFGFIREFPRDATATGRGPL